MSTVNTATMRGDGPGTYFAYLSYSNQMPAGIKALIDRYNITVYDNDDDVGDFCSELESVPANSFDTEMSNTSFLVNISTNNNDDDDKCVQSPAQTTDKKRLKLPSLTRRLSKFGKRSSCDKTKTAVESGSACDSESVETASFTETSMTTVDEPHLQSPDTCIALKDEDQDNQKNKYKEGNYCGRSEQCGRYLSSNVIVVIIARQFSLLLLFSHS